LGPFEHHNVLCVENAIESVLGLYYLRRFDATIDFPKKKVYLRPSCHYAKSEAELRAFYGENVLGLLLRESAAEPK
jgi:hypothetical protein